jgi:hypothetical protein
MPKIISGAVVMILTLFGSGARAQELDILLPDSIPGYGTPFGVIAETRDDRQPALGGQSMGTQWGDMSLVPEVTASTGYDSAPDGATGSAVAAATPSLSITDPILGFGAYAAANGSLYPQDPAQNTSGATLALGERAILPRETITISAGYLSAQETGFALDTFAITRPVRFSVLDLRASDEISAGMFTLKPQFNTTAYRIPNFSMENHTDNREAFTTTYIPGGAIDLVLRLQATQSAYQLPIFNANTNQALAGLVDTADGLWTFRALAGAAQRQPRFGAALIAPVLEASLDWMPTGLDRLRLTLMREIDDPDEIGVAPYTLNQESISLAHEYLTNVFLNFSEQVSNAAYLHSTDQENLFTSDANVSWQLNTGLTLDSDYTFNDRQANYLRAANEHVVTLGLTWRP